MGVFKDASDAEDFLGGIFEKAMEIPALADELASSGVVLRIGYSDPDSQITVDMPNKKVFKGANDLTPGVELFMTADMGNKFWLGNINLPIAMAKGQVRAKGPVPKVLKLIPVSKQLFPYYAEMLEERGRNDLIAAG